MSLIDKLTALDERLSGDNEPGWATIVGPMLALGLFLRGATHVWTALIARELGADVSPDLGAHDITFRSPVADLQGHPVEWTARGMTTCVGLGTLEMVGLSDHSTAVVAFVLANVLVCICDPLAGVAVRLRPSHPDR